MSAAQSDLTSIKAPVRPETTAAAAALAAGFVLAVAQAAVLGFALAALVSEGRLDNALLGGWVALSVLRLGAVLLADTLGGEAASKLKRLTRARVGAAFLNGAGAANTSLVAALNDDVDALGPYIARYEPVRAALGAGMAAALVFAFSQSWVVGAILVLTGPLTPLFMALVGYKAQAEARLKLDALQDMSRYFLARLRTLDIISAYGGQALEAERLRTRAQTHRAASVGVLRVAFLSSATIDFFATLSIALVATYIGLSLLGIMPFSTGETINAAEGFAALMIAPEFFAPLRRFAQAYHDRADAAAAAERLAPLLGQEAAPGLAVSEVSEAAPGEHIVATALRAGFPGGARTQPLNGVFRKGELTALIGESGVGKSALLHTLAGLIAPAAGRVQQSVSPPPVLVAQTPFLFAATVRENLTLGAAYTDERLVEAIVATGLAGDASAALTMLERPVGEIALGVSGGEGRRLAVARALLADAPVLLLDEPTAHLDRESERALIATLKQLARGRVIIAATHSPALCAAADQVIEVALA
jgi:ATP-binding cassette subfamily C protein CydD